MPASSLGSLLWFLAILALIPLVLWGLKRKPLGSGGGTQGLRSIASLALAPNQRIVTVEVGSGEERRWLVLGVTPQSITTLYTMAPQDGTAAPGAPMAAPPFAQLLSRLKGSRDEA